MKKRLLRTPLLLATGAALLLSGCGTAPGTPRDSQALSVLAATPASEKVRIAEASGSRGAWIIGSRGAWIIGNLASTTPGLNNTFPENLAEWNQIRLPQAQARTPALGQGVVVAVIDTGLDLTHPAFGGSLAHSSEWRDWVDGDQRPNDDGTYDDAALGYGHGTTVASIVAQVAPNVTLLPLRVLGPDGSGDVADVVAAIDYAVDAGVQIINLSVGTHNSSAVDLAVQRATAQGVYVVASSGNTGDHKVTAPARYAVSTRQEGQLSLSVGSVNTSDLKSTFSTFGQKLEVLAPGEGIVGAAPGGLTEAWSGTSMAAPVASGLIALVLGELNSAGQARWSGQVAVALAETADSIDAVNAPALSGQLGRGRLNAERFVQRILGEF